MIQFQNLHSLYLIVEDVYIVYCLRLVILIDYLA
jgi:hypothetical protein